LSSPAGHGGEAVGHAVGPIDQLIGEFDLTAEHSQSIFGINFTPVNDFIHSLGLPDFVTINKAVIIMWLAAILSFALITYAGRGRGLVASGVKNMMEALFQFVKLDIVDDNLGDEGKRYLPLVGGLFFFILFNNLLGLIPFGFSPFANLSATATLALIVFVTIVISGMMKQGIFGYWKNLAPAGVPKVMYIILYPIEFVSLLAKPFSLSVRLFANMLAGHIVIFALLMMILLFGYWMAPISITVAVLIFAFEIFVAFIQAYIFAILSSVYIGQAVHPEH
jgi:F-type H+-transporting ATPase subunit a